MKRLILTTFVLALFPLAGCDAAKEPYAKAAQAESEGKLAEARALYGEVCTKAATSPLCPLAKKRIPALGVREAYQALDAGEWSKAKELFTTAKTSDEPALKQAGDKGLEDEELVFGLKWDEAQKAEKPAARALMEEISGKHVKVAVKAREWLAKNAPGILLEEIKAACKKGGAGSCVELGDKMADVWPQSPEAAEAQKLVDAEYERIRKPLKDAEALLVQRLEVYQRKAKLDACNEEGLSDCLSELSMTEQDAAFSTGPIERMFATKLEEIGDPGYQKRFKDRYAAIESRGEHDFTKWEPRGDKKK